MVKILITEYAEKTNEAKYIHYEELAAEIGSGRIDVTLLGVFVYRAGSTPHPHAIIREDRDDKIAYTKLRNMVPTAMRDNHQLVIYSTYRCKKWETFAVKFSDWIGYLGPIPTEIPAFDSY